MGAGRREQFGARNLRTKCVWASQAKRRNGQRSIVISMQILNDTSFDFGKNAAQRRSVVTIGAYDGVHRGHQTVIEQVRQQAEILDARSVVVTFDRHPASVVRPASAPLLLTDLDQKLELLAATGLDATCIVKFDEE